MNVLEKRKNVFRHRRSQSPKPDPINCSMNIKLIIFIGMHHKAHRSGLQQNNLIPAIAILNAVAFEWLYGAMLTLSIYPNTILHVQNGIGRFCQFFIMGHNQHRHVKFTA